MQRHVQGRRNRHRQQPPEDPPDAQADQDGEDRDHRMKMYGPSDDKRHDDLILDLADDHIDHQDRNGRVGAASGECNRPGQSGGDDRPDERDYLQYTADDRQCQGVVNVEDRAEDDVKDDRHEADQEHLAA